LFHLRAPQSDAGKPVAPFNQTTKKPEESKTLLSPLTQILLGN